MKKFKDLDFIEKWMIVFMSAVSIITIITISMGFIIAFTAKAHAAWETTGNVVTTGEFIGTTNNTAFTIKTANQDKITILPTPPGNPAGNTEIRVQAGTIFSLQNQLGQNILNHSSSNGCTGLFGNVTKMFVICNNGFDFIGAPVNFKTNYTVAPNTAYTLTTTDYTVECMPNGWEYLPTAVGVTGKHYEFVNPHNAMCTVFANGSELIGNLNPEPKYKIQAGGAVTIVSNNVGWRVISKYQVQ